MFSVEIFTLSHFIYKKDDFLSDIKVLRKKLTDKNDPEFILKGQDPNNVPVDSLFNYMRDIWEIIEQNKDIDIPNQKRMVANYRCQEIKNDQLAQSTRQISNLKSELKINPNMNLSMKFDAILSQSLREYEKETVYYDDDVVQTNISQLKDKLMDEFEEVFKSQNEKQTREFLQLVEGYLKRVMNNQKNNIQQSLELAEIKVSEMKELYHNYIDDFDFDQSEKNEFIAIFEKALDTLVNSFLSQSTNIFIKKIVRQKNRELENQIFETF